VLSGSFLDYGISRADDLPLFCVEHAEHPTAGNPLRIKGGDEGGIVPATAAVKNAVCDALAQADVDVRPMPAMPAVVWEKVRGIGNLSTNAWGVMAIFTLRLLEAQGYPIEDMNLSNRRVERSLLPCNL